MRSTIARVKFHPRSKDTGLSLSRTAEGKIGFNVDRVRGSHHILIHSDGRRTVVPVHSGETIGRGLLAQILRDCQITRDEFRSLF